MAKSRTQASKNRVIEALVLAFSSSGLREVVGTDALRSVLSVEYNDLVESGAFDLQQVWELLEKQPGFSPEAAKAPLCLFKSWEAKLGIEVALPDELEGLSAKERALLANSCKVSSAQRSRLFGEPKDRDSRRAEPSTAHQKKQQPAVNRPWLFALAAAIALLGFGFAGYSLIQGCRGPQWRSLAATSFAGDLPIADARQMGTQVGARLTDSHWMSLPEETRREQLHAALRRLDDRHIDVLFLQDANGEVQASAQLYDDGRKIRVQFH